MVVDGSYFRGYSYFTSGGPDGQDTNEAIAVTLEPTRVPLVSRSSTLWRAAEIRVERKDDVLIFTREQDDLTQDGLEDFLKDCSNYLQHLREEAVRYGE